MNKLIRIGKIINLFCILILLTPLFVKSGAAYLDPGSEYEWVEYLYKRGESDLVIREGLRFTYLFPSHELADKALMLVGKSYLKVKRYDKALETFQELSKGGNRRQIREKADMLICLTLFRQGNNFETQRFCEELSKHNLDTSSVNSARYIKGWSLLRQWKWKSAKESFNEIDKNSILFDSAQDIVRETNNIEGMRELSPRTAGLLSGLIPGSGYIYAGKWRTGLMAFLVNAVFIGSSIECLENDLPVLGGIIALVELGWYTGTIYGSINSARQYNYRVKEGRLNALDQKYKMDLLKLEF